MATVNGGLSTRTQARVKAKSEEDIKKLPPVDRLQAMLKSDVIQSRFTQLLGKKSVGFMSSLLSLYRDDHVLQTANPESVITAGAMAATLDLPINKNLGFAYIVPYGGQAQFQMGYKGYIQLAMRSGQYKTINACEVYEGEIKDVNRFTGDFEFGQRTSDKIVGYMAYFKLVNGFEKYMYMSIEEMQAHARKHSKNYKGGTEKWGITDFNSMAIKTVLKRLISKFGIMSIEMQDMNAALSTDGGIIREDATGNFVPEFDGETIEVKAENITEPAPVDEAIAALDATANDSIFGD